MPSRPRFQLEPDLLARRRKALRRFAEAYHGSINRFADRAGLPGKSSLYLVLKGEAVSLTDATVERLRRTVAGATRAAMFGEAPGPRAEDGLFPMVLPVGAVAHAAHWRRPGEVKAAPARRKTVQLPGGSVADELVWLEDGHAAPDYPAGTFLVLRTFGPARLPLPAGGHVVVSQEGNGLLLTTVRQILVDNLGRTRLVARGTDRGLSPIPVWTDGRVPHARLRGLVIAAFSGG